MRILTNALQLDTKGRTQGIAVRLEPGRPAVQVNARVIADTRSNSLIVTATPESYPVIEQLLSKLEESPAKATVDFRIIPLQFAAADEVSRTLSNLVSSKSSAPGVEAPRIEADPSENRLIIAATPEQFRTIQDVVKAIDFAATAERHRVVPLSRQGARPSGSAQLFLRRGRA